MLRLEDAIVESLSIDVEGSRLELGETRFTGTYFGRHLTISRGQSSLGSMSLGANADIRFDNGIALATDIDWAGPVLDAPASGRVTLNGDYPLLKIHQDLRAPFAATADGTLDFTDAMRFDLALAWTGLVIPNVDHFASPAGTGKLTGTIADYAYDFSGTIDVDGRVANESGNGRGARGELAFERIVLGPLIDGAAAGTLRAAGTVSFARSVADLTLDAAERGPALDSSERPRRLSGSGTLHTEFAPAFRHAPWRRRAHRRASALPGHRQRRGRRRRQQPLASRQARARLGPNRISLDGTLSLDDLDVAVAARVDNLDLVWPGLRGGLEGRPRSPAPGRSRAAAATPRRTISRSARSRSSGSRSSAKRGCRKTRGSISRSTRAGSRAARSRSTRSRCRSRARLPRTARGSRRTRRTGSRP